MVSVDNLDEALFPSVTFQDQRNISFYELFLRGVLHGLLQSPMTDRHQIPHMTAEHVLFRTKVDRPIKSSLIG